ncbi:MATE family efflux transporter [Hippea jasoniae]|uniref:MATE family efflux transporter n=1 Tax=Hippea jasoniae TaxID=944479 RepID=UPI0005581608|nr:MATE family efflux transporter [Hippea jasoniae]
MILEMVAQNVFNFVDMYFVSRISDSAIGALVSSSITVMVVFSFSVGVSTASGIFISTYWGGKKYTRAFYLYSNGFFFSFLLGVFFSVVFGIFLTNIVDLVGLRGQTAFFAKEYLGIILFGFPVSFLFSFNNSTLRSISLPSFALKIMVLSNILNIIFDPLFIFYFGMGIKGAALSTVLSVFIGIFIQTRMLVGNGFYIKIALKYKIIKKIVQKGVYSTLHLLYRITSMLVLIRIVGMIAQNAISSYSVIIRIYQVLLFIVFGLANTAFVIAGQNYGAKNFDRVKKGVFSVLVVGFVVIGLLDMTLYIFKDNVIGIFVNELDVASLAKRVLFFYFISYPFVALATISARSSMALHDTKRPSLINLVNLWFFMIPLAYFLSRKMGLDGVWIAIAISNFTNFLANFVLFNFNLKRVYYEINS